MNSLMAPIWLASFLEKDNASRTSRATRCLSVLLKRNTAKVTLYLLPVAATTSDEAEHLGLASVDVIGSARRTAVDARQSAAVPEPTLRVGCEATPQVGPTRTRGAAAVPTRLSGAAWVPSAPCSLSFAS